MYDTNYFRPIETVETDDSEVEDAASESGIVSESVSATSVILMFGGTGKFKKTPSGQGKNILVQPEQISNKVLTCVFQE